MACHYGLLDPGLIIIVVIILLLGNPALPVIVVIVAVAAAAQQQGQTQTYRSRYPHDVVPFNRARWSD
jgi:hypothetical protein